jgi:hypothetical protein
MQKAATMTQQITIHVFLIRRLNIELCVMLRSSGLVKVEPYQCKDEHLRLWTGIAKTQTLLAQALLEQEKAENPLRLLYALFQNNGWQVRTVEERKEFSL